MSTLEQAILAAHPAAELGKQKDGTGYWRVAAEAARDAAALLKQAGCTRFLDLTVVDDPARADRFDLNWLFYSMQEQRWFRLKARSAGTAPSIVALFPAAALYEREVWALFGVRFEGHEGLSRLLLPDDWKTHPLRKDEPLGGEPVDFTVTREG